MKLLKEVVKKNGKKYTNFVLVVELNGNPKRIPIEVKTFGKSWDSQYVRTNYALLNLASELVIKEDVVQVHSFD